MIYKDTPDSFRVAKGLALAFLLGFILLRACALSSQSHLLYLELQALGGYSTAENDIIFYSHHPQEVMQKPSLGLDLVQRFHSGKGDWGVLALQARLAYNQDIKPTIEPQLYNAYFKLKSRHADIWLGHNRPAFGMSTYIDNHASLLSDFGMIMFNYDRDWGVGLDTEIADIYLKISATTGSGMRFEADGSHLLAGRLGYKELSRDNYTLGLGFRKGKTLETMGYKILHGAKQHPEVMASADMAWRYLNYELKADASHGEFLNRPSSALLMRGTLYLLGEDRLAIETQYLGWERVGDKQTELSLSTSLRLSPYLSIRTLASYDPEAASEKYLLQLYWYGSPAVLLGH